MSKNTLTSEFIKIILLGSSGVGKSTFASAYSNDHKGDYVGQISSTIGIDIVFKKSPPIKNFGVANIQLYDTAGQEKFRSTTVSYCRQARGVILMYDVSNYQSFNDLKYWFNLLKETKEREDQIMGIHYEVIIVANKYDIEKYKINVPMEESLQFSQHIRADHVFCSSLEDSKHKTDVPVLNLLHKIIKLEDFLKNYKIGGTNRSLVELHKPKVINNGDNNNNNKKENDNRNDENCYC